MDNPINSSVFDSRDLIAYKDSLETELIDAWNAKNGKKFPATHITDLFGTGGYEYADNAKNQFAEFQEEYDTEHYKNLNEFCETLSVADDFEFGEAIIHENYFTEYVETLSDDLGYSIPNWMVIDWETTADNVKADFKGADFEDETYYIRL